MRVITDKVYSCDFLDLKPGEVFIYEGCYYMRIAAPMNENNAVNLSTGTVLKCTADKPVVLVTTASLKIL